MTTALYRRYRPETFAEVVGQDHVTAPLRQALRSGQTNHAYLFSGPRGCGKTTSARILARCLNCAQGPTDTPCGVCESCVELARGGPGSLDVVEIDAASHGGVDDARDLRERATFAPARDRYKVFILDEAHMVSPQGFNALLKIVEEPPEHVKFIFATTEPDKVIGTIRSRTHHYPFRLVPPDVMVGYLDQLCTAEGVRVGSGVLPLVVRAGGGSVRDSLSVLDQLIAGSGPDGLGYEDAVALLGYTHASLLDDLVEAVAARDGASAFRVVERVISTGHEPRRFVEDLLERLRDLIVLAASGDAAAAVLRDVPGDQMARMQTQARQLGAAELSRSADLVNAALSEMTGATSPRLHLELLMARLLLPALDDTAAGIGARVDRLEREGVRVAPGGAPGAASLTSGAPAAPAASAAAARPVPDAPAPAPAVEVERVAVVTPAPEPIPAPAPADRTAEAVESGVTGRHAPDDAPGGATDEAVPAAPGGDTDEAGAAAPEPHDERVVDVAPAAPVQEAVPHDVPVAEPAAPAERPAGAPGGGDTEMLRRRWPEVLDTLGRLKKTTWVLISQNAQVVELNATTLTLGFGAPGLASAFRGGSHADLVQQAVRETLGFAVKVEGVLAGDGAAPARGPASGPAPTSPNRGSGAPSAAEAAASWDAPAARPAPVPAPTAEAQRAPRPTSHDGGADGAGAPGVPDTGEDEPEAVVDPWSVAVATGPADGTASAPTADAAPDGDAPARATTGATHDTAAVEGVDSPHGAGPTDGAAPSAEARRRDGAASGPTAVSEPDDAADLAWPEVAAPGGAATGPGRGEGGVRPGDAPADHARGDRARADRAPADPAPGGRAPHASHPDGPAADPGAAPRSSSAGAPEGEATPSPAAVGGAGGPVASVERPATPGSGASGARGAADGPAPAGPASAGPAPAGPAVSASASTPVAPDAWPEVRVPGGATPTASVSAADGSDPGAPSSGSAPARSRAGTSGSAPAAPPPWDVPDPQDPGAPEPPPEDDWASVEPPMPDGPPDEGRGARRPGGPAPTASSSPTTPPRPAPGTPGAPAAQPTGADRVRAARAAAEAGAARAAAAPERNRWADDEPSMDDPDIGANGLSGVPLVVQVLRATVIEELVDEGY